MLSDFAYAVHPWDENSLVLDDSDFGPMWTWCHNLVNAHGISPLVMSKAETEDVDKEIRLHETVAEAKISRDKFVDLQLRSSGSFSFIEKILSGWFSPEIQLKKSYSVGCIMEFRSHR